MSFFNKITPQQPDTQALPNFTPVEDAPECALAFHAEAPNTRDRERVQESAARLSRLIKAEGLHISEVAKAFHHVDRDGSPGHSPAFVWINSMIRDGMREIKRLETDLDSTAPDALPDDARIALDQAHCYDPMMREIVVEELKAVLGEPELADAQLDPEYDPEGIYHRPGIAGSDQLIE